MEKPSVGSQVFASVFTPSWALGLLLFGCLFLPAYEGCDGKVVYNYQIEKPGDLDFEYVYYVFLRWWIFAFGLLVALGTLRLVWSGAPNGARLLWIFLALLIVVHAALLSGALASEWGEWRAAESHGESESPNRKDSLVRMAWTAGSIVLLALVPLSLLRCRSWLVSAMRLQLGLAVVALFFTFYFVPAILFAQRALVGGCLAMLSNILLVVATIFEQLDGDRVLKRSRGDPSLRLGLRTLLLLITICGVACAIILVYWSPPDTRIGIQTAP